MHLPRKMVSHFNGLDRLRYFLGLCLLIFYLPVDAHSYDVLCPDSENPLNIPFLVPKETLVNGTTVQIDPIVSIAKYYHLSLEYAVTPQFSSQAIDFLDPRDVACKTNYDDVTVEQFKRAVKCNFKGPKMAICTVDENCIAQRRRILQKLRKATLWILDEVVIKIQGIKFFNKYRDAKHLLFGTERLSKLTGLEMAKKATSGPVNIVNGFSVTSESASPSRKLFGGTFSKPIELYSQLRAAEEPTGRLAEQNTCTRTSELPFLTTNELNHCYELFFNGFKDKSKLDIPDAKLHSLLEEALEYSFNTLTEGKKKFPGLKLPFSGHCVNSDGLEPTSLLLGLLNIVETVKSL